MGCRKLCRKGISQWRSPHLPMGRMATRLMLRLSRRRSLLRLGNGARANVVRLARHARCDIVAPAPACAGRRCHSRPTGNVMCSRTMARLKTSPLSSLRGSNQPRPSWVTIKMLPPSRYLTASRVLSRKSSSYPALSSTASQLRWREAPLILLVHNLPRPHGGRPFIFPQSAGHLLPAAKSGGCKGAARN